MDKILEAVSTDNVEQLDKLLHDNHSSENVNGSESAFERTNVLDSKEIQDAFTQAAFCGSVKTLEALSKYVTDIDGLGQVKWYPDYPVSPLRAAVENDKIECVRWLCRHGANTRLCERVCNLFYNNDYSVSNSCFTNYCTISCFVPLHFARSSACTNILLEYDADINARDCMGKTPLSMATLHGRLDVMETLCQHAADINLGSIWGATPLVYAQYASTSKKRAHSTEILCRHGADVNFQDRNGRTAMHAAKDVECVHTLLAYGADPNIETICGKTPFVSAAEGQLWDIVWLLYDAQVKANVGLLSSGVSLFSCLSLDTLSLLLKAANDVRELTHLCRSAIRSQLLRSCSNVDEAITCLPLPPRVKLYVGLWCHIQNIN